MKPESKEIIEEVLKAEISKVEYDIKRFSKYVSSRNPNDTSDDIVWFKDTLLPELTDRLPCLKNALSDLDKIYFWWEQNQ